VSSLKALQNLLGKADMKRTKLLHTLTQNEGQDPKAIQHMIYCLEIA